jgi:hypothetical protein
MVHQRFTGEHEGQTMKSYPIAYAHEEIEGCACAIVKQLEDRDHDPVMILLGDGEADPTPFHRRRFEMPDGNWSWEAADDRGRSVRSGVVHDEPPPSEEETEGELAPAGMAD